MADKAEVNPPENQEQDDPRPGPCEFQLCDFCSYATGDKAALCAGCRHNRAAIEHLGGEIKRLADHIVQQVDGEPSRDEGAVDCAIRLLKKQVPPPPEPVMRQVSSSNIAAVGYDEQRQRLVVRFHNGSRYAYFNVPLDVHQNLVEATSVSGFLHRNIRGKFAYGKLEG